MKQLIVLVGPPGSGKSSLAQSMTTHHRISQDDMGKEGHMRQFLQLIAEGENVIIDRLNFNKEQRQHYLGPAKANGYTTKIIVLHESSQTCIQRMMKRIETGHPTIQDEKSARAALHTFMKNYERPTQDEADEIEFRYPEGDKPYALICDLDNTLCDATHREHHVNKEVGKKNWPAFFAGISKDPVNQWCKELLLGMTDRLQIVYCSGRGEEYREVTEKWLMEKNLLHLAEGLGQGYYRTHLYMRQAKDSRKDFLIKENILDFEILTQFEPVFAVDDRKQVVDMWRRRGITCLQCAEGDF